MSIIYQPTGMAREYSPYACNLYIGCSHGVSIVMRRIPCSGMRTAILVFRPREQRFCAEIEKDLQAKKYDKQILLSFIGDVYCDNTDNSQTTRDALILLNSYDAPVAVLTKGVSKSLRDLDVFKAFGDRIAVGSTLTFFDEAKSKEWESGAEVPAVRLAALKTLYDNGIRTFASFESCIDPAESLKLIKKTLEDNSVDHYKVGKVNNYKGLDKGVDWTAYLKEVLTLLRAHKKQIYVKSGIRALVRGIEYLPEETDPDYFVVRA